MDTSWNSPNDATQPNPSTIATGIDQEIATSWDEQDYLALMRWDDDGGAPSGPRDKK